MNWSNLLNETYGTKCKQISDKKTNCVQKKFNNASKTKTRSIRICMVSAKAFDFSSYKAPCAIKDI